MTRQLLALAGVGMTLIVAGVWMIGGAGFAVVVVGIAVVAVALLWRTDA